MKTSLLTTLPSLALACILPACGGGGSDSPSPGSGDQTTSYTVTPSVSGGTISPSDPVLVQSGDSVTFTFTPDSGNSLTNLNVSNTCGGGILNGNAYRIKSVTADCTVTGTFNQSTPAASIAACFTATETVNFAMVSLNAPSDSVLPDRSITGPMIYNGQMFTGQKFFIASGSPVTQTNYWRVTNDSVISGATVYNDGNIVYSNMVLPVNMKPGQVATDINDARRTFVGFETITLAGKTFSNTCHVSETNVQVLSGSSETWWASGYGVIKQTIANGIIMQYSGDL